MRFLVCFFISSLCACGQQPKINPQAKALNDSAVNIGFLSGENEKYEKAISLLDEALKIDSNYLTALGNKLSFQIDLGQVDKALETAKQIKRIKPDVPDYSELVGVLYEKNGDSIAANKYFAEAAIQFDNVLKTMSTGDKNYTLYLMNKATNLILLGKEQDGNNVLKELYEKEKDGNYKELIAQFMGKPRKYIIDNFFGGGTQSSLSEISNDK